MVYLSCTGITGNSLRYNACAVVSSTIFLLGCLWKSPKKKKKIRAACVSKKTQNGGRLTKRCCVSHPYRNGTTT